MGLAQSSVRKHDDLRMHVAVVESRIEELRSSGWYTIDETMADALFSGRNMVRLVRIEATSTIAAIQGWVLIALSAARRNSLYIQCHA